MPKWAADRPRGSSLPVIAALAVVLLLTSVSLPASAENILKQAKRLFGEAEVHYNLGEFDQALSKYEAAYRVKPLPGFLFNIGQCQRQLGNCKSALFNYRQYLTELPNAPNQVDVEDLISLCETELAAQEQHATAAAEEAAAAAVQIDDSPAPARTTWLGLSPVVWSGIGLGTVLLTTGIVTGAIALDKSSTYKDSSTPIDERQQLKDSGETLGAVSTATLISSGVVALGTVAYWWFVDKPTYRASVAFDPEAGTGFVSFGGQF